MFKKIKESNFYEKTKKNLLGIIVIIMLLVMPLALFNVGCMQDRSHDYTIEEHIQNISNIVQSRFIDSDEFEDFEVHPIFTPDGAFSDFVLIELAPLGFMYVRIFYEELVGGGGMGCGGFFERIPDYITFDLFSDKTSHFYGIEQENRYFFIVESIVDGSPSAEVIPAIREGNNFLNLISLEVIYNETSLENQITITLIVSGMLL